MNAPRHLLTMLSVAIAALASACAHVAPDERRQQADASALAKGWQGLRLPTAHFVLAAYAPAHMPVASTLTVFIEGDGLAWLSPSQASDDPTPRTPVALQLALQHTRGPAVYLARPCQYVQGDDQRGCDVTFWTGQRFSQPVIDASDQAIDALKQRFGATHLVLVGYSGGGAVAALLAARRVDVVRLVTVAGNLDPVAWTRAHAVSPLTGSLNPADAWQALQHIPQVHFVGARDTNITAEVVSSYLNRFPETNRPRMHTVAGADHGCCWVQQWPALSQIAFP